jgi:hypothetical protein
VAGGGGGDWFISKVRELIVKEVSFLILMCSEN